MARERLSPSQGMLTAGAISGSDRRVGWRPDGCDDWELTLTVDGRARFGSPGQDDLFVDAGDAVIIRPRVFHDYGAEEEKKYWDVLWCHFVPSADWLPLLDWQQDRPGISRIGIDDADEWAYGVERMRDLIRFAERGEQKRAWNCLEAILLSLDKVRRSQGTSERDPRLSKVMEWCVLNHAQASSLADLAQIAGISASRLGQLFRAELGISPLHFLEIQRVRRARELLRQSSQPIARIAQEVGFDDAFYFSRRFAHHMGCSPSRYRAGEEGRGRDRWNLGLEAT